MHINENHPLVTAETWEKFTDQEHQTWNTLFERQEKLLENAAVTEFMDSIKALSIDKHKIPKFSQINKILKNQTNFSVVAVKGLIPDDLFFHFLSQRKFPSTCFIRTPEQMDYLQEPDIFHDVFGHVPLLVDPIFADFMELFGHKGLEAIELGLLKYAARLYWFTVEFGLIHTLKGLRIYGAGIVSSSGESQYSLESNIPTRIKFNCNRVMKTDYHIDSFQRTYFVINNYQELFDALDNLNWHDVRNDLLNSPNIPQGTFINEEERYHLNA
jgi:phenylalanine-4-hydroxylase